MVIRHEAVPRFKGRDGRVATMASMTMAFGMGPGVSLQGLRAGDKIAFDFEVRWHEEPALLLTRLSRLPASTKLALPP